MLSKKEKDKLKAVAVTIQRITDIRTTNYSKEQIIDLIGDQDIHFHYNTKSEEFCFNNERLTNAVSEISNEGWVYFLTKLKEEIKEREKEIKLTDFLLPLIQKKYPKENIKIDELVELDEDYFGVKFLLDSGSFVWDYDGNLYELANAICRTIKKSYKNILECPYCGISKAKHLWDEDDECRCGVNIVHEFSRPNKLGFIIDLVGGEKGEPIYDTEDDWMVWFLKDESFKLFEELVEDDNWEDTYINNYVDNTGYTQKTVDSIIIDEHHDIVDKELLKKIVNETNKIFCWWVIKGAMFKDSYDELDFRDSNKFFRLKEYKTIEDWMMNQHLGREEEGDNEYNIPYFPVFYDIFINIVNVETGEKYLEKYNVHDISKMSEERRAEFYDCVDYLLETVDEYFKDFSTVKSWKDYNEFVYEGIEEEDAEINENERRMEELREKSKKLWDDYFPEIISIGRLTAGNSKEFLEKLEKVVPVLSDDEFEAMSIFPPENGLSNKIRSKFGYIFRRNKKR